ncbi:MAG: hypothetical protein HY736_07280 [Verrucomicrobia bacterium]|nr:hypothetical protein [Verrucomicrobiota bacterium]
MSNVTIMKKILPLLSSAFVLHAAGFPDPFNSQHRSPPMTATEAAATVKLPPGFKVSVFAEDTKLE